LVCMFPPFPYGLETAMSPKREAAVAYATKNEFA
jgi:hypothetical protein